MPDNYPTFRVHASAPTFSDPGVDHADFRGDAFIGAAQGDHHTTVVELNVSALDDAELALLERIAMKLNSEGVHQVGGQYVGLRAGLWDKIAPV